MGNVAATPTAEFLYLDAFTAVNFGFCGYVVPAFALLTFQSDLNSFI
jgi:hypothetical protein